LNDVQTSTGDVTLEKVDDSRYDSRRGTRITATVKPTGEFIPVASAGSGARKARAAAELGQATLLTIGLERRLYRPAWCGMRDAPYRVECPACARLIRYPLHHTERCADCHSARFQRRRR